MNQTLFWQFAEKGQSKYPPKKSTNLSEKKVIKWEMI